ncbi:double-stranded RNA-binding protein 2 [Morus notabilis]|uniref:double-stranded RNA-binding protein 2 n=1 Tax=Morus notabilis TaxID=981085 RepID=UPI000CED6F74|nr:double-stranded RNA-binding protein 2 [Morus notabilis]
MYKNQLQELAQRSCFNLPSYTCIREGPDHAPRFKATVNFNGETFESPHYCSTLRQAEHSAAEVALNSLSNRGPSHSLAARILDETGVYKNLLQEIAQRVGAPLPQYTTYRSGLGHLPVFTGTVELAGITFTGEPAKNKKQAEKNAAMAAWSSLKQLAKETASSSEAENSDELEQITIARALLNYRLKEKMANPNSPIPFPKKFPVQPPRPTSPQTPLATTSKILPLICQKTASRNRLPPNAFSDSSVTPSQPPLEGRGVRHQRSLTVGALPFVPMRQMRASCHGMAPPVTMRTVVPVYSAPPLPPPAAVPHQVIRAPPVRIAPQVTIRQAVPVFAAPPVRRDDSSIVRKEDPLAVQKEDPVAIQKEEPVAVRKDDPVTVRKDDLVAVRKEDPPAAVVAPTLQNKSSYDIEATEDKTTNDSVGSEAVQSLEQLKI